MKPYFYNGLKKSDKQLIWPDVADIKTFGGQSHHLVSSMRTRQKNRARTRVNRIARQKLKREFNNYDY